MANCKKIENELQRVVDFRIGNGASKRHSFVFDKKNPFLPGPLIFTDGEKIHIPAQFNLTSNDTDNQMLIASAVRHESDHIKEFMKLHRELSGKEEYDSTVINRFLEDFFLQSQFKENPTLAHEIFNVVEDNRIDHKAREELPGLKQFSEQKEKPIYLSKRPSPKYLMKRRKELDAFRELFLQKTLLDKTVDEPSPKHRELLKDCVRIAKSAEGKDINASLEATEKIYAKFKENFDITPPIPRLPPFAGRDHDRLSPGVPKNYRGEIKPGEGREENKQDLGKQRQKAKSGKEKSKQDLTGEKSKAESGEKEESKELKKEKGSEEDKKEEFREKEGKRKESKEKIEKIKGEEKTKKEKDSLEKKRKEENSKKDRYSYIGSRGPFIRIVPKPSPGVNLRVPHPRKEDIDSAQEIINKYSGEIRAIESYFKRLEQRYRGKKTAREGEEINIREYVQAELEYEATGIRSNRKMFRKRARIKRKAAWAALADISASTAFGFGYRIIDCIKDALLIQGEALNYSNYPFGIFAFHSGGTVLEQLTEYKDTVYLIKNFNEKYTEETRGRIMSLSPYGGTLMVNAIEYISKNLREVEGRPKGLSIITDGEPDNPRAVRYSLKKLQEDDILPFLFVIGSEHERYAKSLVDNYIIIKRDKLNELPREVLRIFTTYGIIK
ncbi:hypothetical protein J7M02_00270 [Candidatus Aerophobetes bacterium]|nr:hypothetical protein [Candidatus Aerophobetes bacterium]